MSSAVKHVSDWSQFVEARIPRTHFCVLILNGGERLHSAANLLRHNVVCGIALISHQGSLVYQHGTLKNLPPNNWKQFVPVFKLSGEKHNQKISERGFQVEKASGEVKKFTVYHQTHCSVYCGSSGRESGLLICNLPYGVLITLYQHPHTAGNVVPVVEDFCAKLRT